MEEKTEEMHNLFLRIPKRVYKQLKFHSIEKEITMGEVIEVLMETLPKVSFKESSCK